MKDPIHFEIVGDTRDDAAGEAYDKTGAMGDETTVLAENTVNELDARKALAMLKLKMRKRS